MEVSLLCLCSYCGWTCRSHYPANCQDPDVPTLSTPSTWICVLTILKPTNTCRASLFLPPREIRSHMGVTFSTAFSGLTHRTSGGSPWCLSDLAGSKQDQGWSAGDEG